MPLIYLRLLLWMNSFLQFHICLFYCSFGMLLYILRGTVTWVHPTHYYMFTQAHIYVGISGKVVLQINSCFCQLFLLILSFVSKVGSGPATWVHSIDKYWAGLKSTIFVFRYFGYYAATTDKIIAFITKKNHSCYISCSCYVYCYYAIRINNFFYKIVQQYSGV